jgi:glycosyltransferase involved in cell wall biosynthesis
VSRRQTISVIVAVKNGERYLGRCLQSIENQSHPFDEIILVDGRSNDRTVEIARTFPKVTIVNQTGHGIADAYNCGISAATGDLIAFLSHDDEWTSDALAVRLRYLEDHPETAFVRALAQSRLEPGHTPPPGFRLELLDGPHGGAMETLLARREVFTTVGLFDTRFSSAEDLDWFARAKDLGVTSATVERSIVHKSVHDSNLSLTDPGGSRAMLTLLRESIRRKRQS